VLSGLRHVRGLARSRAARLGFGVDVGAGAHQRPHDLHAHRRVYHSQRESGRADTHTHTHTHTPRTQSGRCTEGRTPAPCLAPPPCAARSRRHRPRRSHPLPAQSPHSPLPDPPARTHPAAAERSPSPSPPPRRWAPTVQTVRKRTSSAVHSLHYCIYRCTVLVLYTVHSTLMKTKSPRPRPPADRTKPVLFRDWYAKKPSVSGRTA
jgi:hypothetical protein